MSKTHVPLDQVLDNPHQVRIGTGDLDNLAQSVLAHGLRQLPEARLLVEGQHWTGSYSQRTKRVDGEWRLTDGAAELASGHRRAAAVQLLNDDDTVSKAQLTSVGLVPGYLPVDLQRLSDEEMLDVGTVENLDRQDLSPIEEARLIQEHVDAGRNLSAIAPHFGDRSESWVSNRKRLLQLPTYVQEHVHEGDISIRQAQALARGYGAEIDVTPDGLVEKALRGADSDWLREEVEALIERVEESTSGSPQDMPCAFCGAEAGESCTTRDGNEADFHSAREKALAAKQAGVLQYGEVSAKRLRSLIEPASTQVEYGSDEYSLADLVAAHQILRGYETSTARDGHKARARKLRKEMRRRVDVDGEVSLDAEEVVYSAPKKLRDRLEGVRTIALPIAINRAAKDLTNQSKDQTPETNGHRESTEGASAGDEADHSGSREKGDTDTSRNDAREKSTDGTSQGHETKSERSSGAAEGKHPAVSGEVSGDGTPSSDPNAGHPDHLTRVIDAVEADGHDWKLQSLDEGQYQGTVQNGGKAHIAEGTTPAAALRSAWHSAQNVPADQIGTVDRSDVDRLLSAAGTEMWDDQAAEEASIASLLVAHRVAGERQETWRTKLIAEAVEERVGRVDRDDVPEDVLEEVQAEVERRLEPVEA